MVEGITCCTALYVALLAEGVDRNQLAGPQIPSTARSPSSRRAWIEIPVGAGASAAGRGRRRVALLAEGVDRNLLARLNAQRHPSRPPRGGRG